ncbi:MAG: hypothetical protein PHN84_06310 [Desulfuromonadaceae bacterium]|nr:hypothetical protein [Desulfuromonadaceae bacterium]MDD2855681.1 hypothetical protein [Desulfuromonadaceae bacterium]
MKKISFLLAAGAMMVASGCSTLSTNTQSSNIGIGTQSNFQANLDVTEKITGTCTVNRVLGFKFGDLNTIGTNKKATGVDFSAAAAVSAGSSTGGGGFSDIFKGVQGLQDKFDVTMECASAAAYNAITKSGADVIFAPRYTAEVTTVIPFIMETTNVSVTGYKGMIKNFKQLDTQKILEGR